MKNTLGNYLIENLPEILAELCQYQNCDNCSIGSLFERCPLLDNSPEEALDVLMDGDDE